MFENVMKDLKKLHYFNERTFELFPIKYPESKELTTDELRDLAALKATLIKYSKDKELAMHMTDIRCIKSIFKVNDLGWITWETNKQNRICNYKIFDNSKSACISVIKEMGLEIEFFKAISTYITDNNIDSFAQYMGYTRAESDNLLIK